MNIDIMKILNIISGIILLPIIISCVNNKDVMENKCYPLAISVKDNGFIPYNITKETRTSDNKYTTTFAKDDKIGLFVVDGNGNIQTNNLCLTYDSAYWNYPADTIVYYDNTSTTRYYAYYPYQSTLTSTLYTNATNAASFFSDVISKWAKNLPTDQSTQAKYSAADLMVGEGKVGDLMMNTTRLLTFNMSHQMGMVEINMPYYYLSTDTRYKYIPEMSWTGITPYSMSDSTCHCIVPRDLEAKITCEYVSNFNSSPLKNICQSVTLTGGMYQTINIDGGAKGTPYTMKAGDYYLNNGSVIPNNSTNEYLLAKVIGVVFDTSTSTTDQGYGWNHGYVMALKYTPSSTFSCIWASSDYQSTDESGATFGSFEYKNCQNNDTSSIINNKDGYSETQAINSEYLSSLESDHPAFYYALNYGKTNYTYYAAPTNKANSGWYLPSVGQWYDIITNLGGMSTTPTKTVADGIEWNNNKSGNSGYAYICANNINNFLNAISGYTNYGCDLFWKNGDVGFYWCSSEYSNVLSYDINFTSNRIYFGENNNNKNYNAATRSVLAF